MEELSIETVKVLLNQIGRGDDKAANKLCEHYYDYVYAFARSQIRDDYAAEEIAQKVFLAVLEKPHSFSGEAKFKTWLGSIVKFKVADWLRSHSTENQWVDYDSTAADADPDPNGDILQNLMAREDAAAVRYCIDKLPPKEHERLFLLYYEHLTYAEAAEFLGIPIGSVKSGMRLTFERLRRCLARWIQGGRDA